MKDNFSKQAQSYAVFRPTYPPALAAHIARLSPGHQLVWDCATGNGQMAVLLARHFERVIATDLSEKQLAFAIREPNIDYRQEAAQRSSLADHSADAVVIAQAVHWFNFDDFYREVRRVVRPGGLIAVVGYGLPAIDIPVLNEALLVFYSQTLGPYWDAERRYIDAHYQTIPFPFEELPFPAGTMDYRWTFDQLTGYLSSWSAVQHYIKAHGADPVAAWSEALAGQTVLDVHFQVSFPIVGRLGIVPMDPVRRTIGG